MDCYAHETKTLVKRVLCGCWILLIAPFLSACTMLDLQSEQSFRSPLSDTPSAFMTGSQGVERGLPIEDFYPENAKHDSVEAKIRMGLTAQESKALGCTLRDRFDRSAALAYNFNDEQSRLALHLGVSGPTFSDPSRFEVNKVMVRFTYNFQKPSSSQKAKCLYPSGLQGVVGSVYNEFFVRENYTIWHELRDRGLDLH